MRSMTGFGRVDANWKGFSITVELKSLNSRYFEIQCRLPVYLSGFEPQFRELIQKKLKRGRIHLTISMNGFSPESEVAPFNRTALLHYVRYLKELQNDPEIALFVQNVDIFTFPGIFEVDFHAEEKEELYTVVREFVEEALEQVIDMQITEFKNLQGSIKEYLAQIKSLHSKIREVSQLDVQELYQKLKSRIEKVVQDINLDQNRLYTEIALLADRADISEELSRLESHIEQFHLILNEESDSGKKLSFLLQEMLREANTIGSKTFSAEVAHRIVELKDMIEKIREQVQNIA